MLKKSLAAALAALLVATVADIRPALARSKEEKAARFADKIKAGIFKLGTGDKTFVEVKLKDKTKLTGYIARSDETSFTVTNLKTGESTLVAYRDVSQVKGHNLSTGAKIGIGIAIGVAVAALIFYLALRGY